MNKDNYPFFLDRIEKLEGQVTVLEAKTKRLKWLWFIVGILAALILFYVVYPIIVHFYYVAQNGGY